MLAWSAAFNLYNHKEYFIHSGLLYKTDFGII